MKHAPIQAAVKTWAEYRAEAAERQKGRGFAGLSFHITDEMLAAADLHMTVLSDPAAKLAQQDAFYARYQVRRGDDRRPS